MQNREIGSAAGGSHGPDVLGAAITRQRSAWRAEGPPDVATRAARVDAVIDLLSLHGDELTAAVDADFGRRPAALTRVTDIGGTLLELGHQRAGLRRWSAERRVGRWSSALGVSQWLRPEPLGVVGVIGAWNFPVHLSLAPAGTALAAGNRVVLRPPPETPATAEVLAELVARHLDPEVMTVVAESDVSGSEFAGAPFDHLFFTGSPRVGALVGAAAAANLVPTTLELGGRNPVVVDRGVDPDRAARLLADGRVLNAGQVCICPDYALVPREDVGRVAEAVLRRWASTWRTVQDNPTYTSVASDRHYERITGLIADARGRGATVRAHVPVGETFPDPVGRTVPPTLVINPPAGSEILSEEVFGPVLSIVGYDAFDDAIAYVADRPSPLVLYWCGDDGPNRRRLIDGTRSGAVNCNDLATHLLSPTLPFGGVGVSGMGRYHGRYGFETFTHLRPVTSSSAPLRMATAMGLPDSLSGRGADALVRGLQAGLRIPAKRRLSRRAPLPPSAS